jgi:hypothetical protein
MSIREFVDSSGLLPPGDHEATLEEIKERLCWNQRRREIYRGLEFVSGQLRAHQVSTIWVDGSFVTSKQRPGDVDVACEVPEGGTPDNWGWCSPARHHDLKKFQRVDLHYCWPNEKPAMKNFFCEDRDGTPKGILRVLVA